MAAARRKLWVGPAGWQYDDWYGVVYPAVRPRGFQPLKYIARYFNAVEVNSSFYRIPTARMTEGWTPLVPREFRFALKLHQSFTHDRVGYPSADDVRSFDAALAPLREARMLGPLLVQFPWSFRHTPGNVERLRRIAGDFPEAQRVIEVRHASWATDEGRGAIAAAGGFCNIDQPALRDCIGPTAVVSALAERGGEVRRVAYFRLHGRNAANWFRDDQPAFERYNYLYSEAEIREWVARIGAAGDDADEVYVVANNHYKGQAPANALELRALLDGAKVDSPAELVRAFPRLAAVSKPRAAETLFE